MRKSLRSKPHRALITALVEARKAAKLTQEQLANRLGRPQSFVAKYEMGERRLDVAEVFEISAALNSPSELIFEAVKRSIKRLRD